MYRWNQILIACHKSFFIAFGLFGNIHLIYIILSTPTFRTKSSLLQCIQSSAHVFCIMNSFIDVYLMISDTGILRETCFNTIFPVVFGYCIQSTIMIFILLDIMIIVSFPLIHRNFPTWKYVTSMTLGPIAWGTFIVTYLCSWDNGKKVAFTALQRPVRRVLAAVTVASNSISLIIFLILIIVFWKKGKSSMESYKVMRHLKVSAAIFIFSNFFSSFAVNTFITLGYSGEDLSSIVGNIVS
ncbi:unnamed protein product [Caenorhabditis nigoni]